MKVATFLPIFNGFYGTLFECLVDNRISDEIESYNDDNNTSLTYDDFSFNICDFEYEIAKDCVNAIEQKLNEIGIICSIKFEKVVSPREYNFMNDSINVEIDFENFNSVIEILQENSKEFAEYIKERYTSCSGFISSYSSYSSDWIDDLTNNAENEMHKVGAVLQFILKANDYTDTDLYYDISDNYYELEYAVI